MNTMKIMFQKSKNSKGYINVNYSDEINNSIKMFIENYPGTKIGYKQMFEMLFIKYYVDKLCDIDDNLFFKQFEFLKENCLLRDGSLNLKGLNGFIKYYLFLVENEYGNFNIINSSFLSYKDFFKRLLDGYKPIIYSPYSKMPNEDKILLDISNTNSTNKKRNILTIDFSIFKDGQIRYLYKDFFWNYPEEYSSKKSKDVWLINFLKIIDKNISAESRYPNNKQTLEKLKNHQMPALKINHIPINRFKEDISDMKSSSQATALSRIRQFIDFESKKGNVKISEIIRKQITSFDVTAEGDLRPYTYEEIEKIKEYLYKENNLKSYLVGSIIEILSTSAMRPATICNLTYNCIQNVNDEGYKVYASSKRNTNDNYKLDKRTGKKLLEVIDKTSELRKDTNNKNYKDYIFLYYSSKTNSKSIKKLSGVEVALKINEVAGILNINQLGTKGIRNYFYGNLNYFGSEEGEDSKIINSLSKHSLNVHMRNYSDSKDFYDACGDYFDIEIGDITVPGTVANDFNTFKNKYDYPLNNENLVQNGCGYCSQSHCTTHVPIECQSCKNYVTAFENLPYYENEIKRLDKEIDSAVSEHEKEFFIFKKAQCVRYWSELELNKKNIKKENFENVENIEKIEKERI